KYLYRPIENAQYALSINGNNKVHQYNISFGYNKDKQALVGNTNQRFTVNANNTISISEKLRIDLQIMLAKTISAFPNQISGGGYGYGQFKTGNRLLYPYAQFIGDNGDILPIFKDYREPFIFGSEEQGLLDWKYYPLEEAHRQGRKLENNAITA